MKTYLKWVGLNCFHWSVASLLSDFFFLLLYNWPLLVLDLSDDQQCLYIFGVPLGAGWEETVAKSFFALIFLVCFSAIFFPAGTGHHIHPAIISLPLVSSRQVVSHGVLAALGHLDSYSPRTDPASHTNKHGVKPFCCILPRCVQGKTLWRAVLTKLRPPKNPNRTVKSRRPTSCSTTTLWNGVGRNGVISFTQLPCLHCKLKSIVATIRDVATDSLTSAESHSGFNSQSFLDFLRNSL